MEQIVPLNMDDLVAFWSKENLLLKEKGYFDRASRIMFDKFLPGLNNKEILDVGCGLGMMMEYFSKQGNEVVGIDIAPRVVKENRRRGLTVVEADARNLPFVDESFDLVYSLGVIEHFEETQQALQEQVRTCKPGGVVVAVVPFLSTPYCWAGILYHRIFTKEHPLVVTYGKPFSKRQLLQKMEAAGCERVIVQPYYGSAFLSALTNRLHATWLDSVETSFVSKYFGLVLWGMGYKRKDI
jgi:ubiquinone/menaquinone biosynthesis C-methylase UbiE